MNTYREYGHRLLRWLPVWLLVSFVIAGITYSMLTRMGPTYSVHMSYLVSLAEREQAPDYKFDGFYALQATDLFTATLAEWMQTPEFVVKAYEAAGLSLPTDNARRLTKTIEAKKSAPQLITVTITGSAAATAEQLAKGLQVATEQNVERYHAEGTPALTFRVVPSEPWTSVVRPSVPLLTGSAFVVVLLLLVNLQLLWYATTYAHRD